MSIIRCLPTTIATLQLDRFKNPHSQNVKRVLDYTHQFEFILKVCTEKSGIPCIYV